MSSLRRLLPVLLTLSVATMATAAGRPRRGQPCDDQGRCAKGLTCLKYYGVAGAAGGEFSSCEHPCSTDKDCPKGEKCITIADGPGQVCRPGNKSPS